MRTYRTAEIARMVGVHPNTVRFYEEQGLITPPKRLPNGYRSYTDLQLEQLRLVRLALRAEMLQSGLRAQAIDVLKRCTALDFAGAKRTARGYEDLLNAEIERAREAIRSVEALLRGEKPPETACLKRREAAERLNVSMDMLRSWEMNGLLSAGRADNGYRMYGSEALERIGIIRLLRGANYSLAAILRLMCQLEEQRCVSVAQALNTPEPGEDVGTVCDRLLSSLEAAREDARQMTPQLEKIEKQTLQ